VTTFQPGLVVLLSSGETSANGRRVLEWLFRNLGVPPRIALLETSAGFQPNSFAVADKVAQFVRGHLPAYSPQVTVVPARGRNTPFSPDDVSIVAPLHKSNVIYLGAGSPTYTVRQLRDSLAWQTILARHRLGAAVVLASAAAIASSEWALPVYEIFKVGDELHWIPGLNLLGAYGLRLAIVSHWDNNDGGIELDTSRGFLGRHRFALLHAMLPPEMTVVGLDEHTALIVDLVGQQCHVKGRGGVCICHGRMQTRFEHGRRFPLDQLGQIRVPDLRAGIPDSVWEKCQEQPEFASPQTSSPPDQILALVREREAARSRRDWATADQLRDQLTVAGWEVRDSPQGQQVTPLSEK